MVNFDEGILLGERSETGDQDNIYYKTYTGPYLDSASIYLDSASIEGEDVTELIRELYGEKCNWCEKLYTTKSLRKAGYVGKLLRMEFTRRNPNVPEFTTMILKTLDTVINPPLFMPCEITTHTTIMQVSR